MNKTFWLHYNDGCGEKVTAATETDAVKAAKHVKRKLTPDGRKLKIVQGEEVK